MKLNVVVVVVVVVVLILHLSFFLVFCVVAYFEVSN